MEATNNLTFKFELNNDGSMWLCSCVELGEIVIGRGTSKIEAMMSFCKLVKEALAQWDDGLRIAHMEAEGTAKQYLLLREFMEGFSNEETWGVVVSPISGDDIV